MSGTMIPILKHSGESSLYHDKFNDTFTLKKFDEKAIRELAQEFYR